MNMILLYVMNCQEAKFVYMYIYVDETAEQQQFGGGNKVEERQ